MINVQQADLHVEEIYELIKEHKDGIALDTLAAKYSSRDATVPYVVGKLLADEKVKTEQRGDKLFCVAVETNNTNAFNTNTSQNPVTSEIALLIQRWDAEAEATQRALKGFAITARHTFITKRMESFGDERLIEMMRLEEEKRNLQNKVEGKTNNG